MSPDGRRVYVTSVGDATLTVVDVASNQVEARIAVGAGPVWVTAAPDGRKVYVASFTDGTLTVIDAATLAVAATLSVGGGELRRVLVKPE